MKKHITWNSAQTWVTKIIKNYRLVCRQPSAYHAKHESKYLIIDRFIVAIAKWSEYCSQLDVVRRLRVVRNSREFVLINHRPSSNTKCF